MTNDSGHEAMPPGERPEGEGRRLPTGEPMGAVVPHFYLDGNARQWVLEITCTWPAEIEHMAEGFALAAATVEATQSVLLGNPDWEWALTQDDATSPEGLA